MTAHYHLASTHFYQCSNFNVGLEIDEKKEAQKHENILREPNSREFKSESAKQGLQLKVLFA